MRIGGGQEIGMACDFSVAQDLARFGQAGPKHGSAPIGGATDFLPVMIGAERAMAACVLCEPFSADEAYFMGVLTDIVPALKVDGKFVANPLVETGRVVDESGRLVFGKPKTGDATKAGQELMKRGVVDLTLLDEKVESLCTKLLYTFPKARRREYEGLRKPKLELGTGQGEFPRLACVKYDDRGSAAFALSTKVLRRPDGKSISLRWAARLRPTKSGIAT